MCLSYYYHYIKFDIFKFRGSFPDYCESFNSGRGEKRGIAGIHDDLIGNWFIITKQWFVLTLTQAKINGGGFGVRATGKQGSPRQTLDKNVMINN